MMDQLSPQEIEARRHAAYLEAVAFVPGTRDSDGLCTYWQLSFATDQPDGFLGGALIEAPSGPAAVARAHQLGCNPGGEVAGVGFRARSVDPAWTNRLLTRDELDVMPAPDGAVLLDDAE